MRQETREKFDNVRRAVEDAPDSYMFAKLPPGGRQGSAERWSGLPADLRDLYELSNGLRVGQVGLFTDRELDRNQYYLDDPEAIEKLGGDRGDWLCFGVHVDFPLVIEQSTAAVWWFPELDRETYLDSRFERLTPDVDEFVTDYLLGGGYLRLSGAEDWWYEFLRDQGFLGD
ncbi:hypothetical protein SMC26_09865 [Actinomadura fulvescens]|uniref:Knr4/Smi1-like domain-containing protein n=1 Tax=Actinomadura fulvescens TaxID=46160 RepID=A0ABP6CDD4_9ACTN